MNFQPVQELEYSQDVIQNLKKELNRLNEVSKNYKSLRYYEDQIYFHNIEKRFKSSNKVNI